MALSAENYDPALKAGAVISASVVLDDGDVTAAKIEALSAGQFIIGVDGTSANNTKVVMSGDATMDATGAVSIASGSTDVTDIEALADGEIIIGVDGTAANNAKVTISGDISLSNAGLTAISSAVIVNADINAAAAIAFTKLAGLTRGSIMSGQTSGGVVTALNAKTDGYILVGDGTDLASVAVTGDISLTNAGVTAVTSLDLETATVTNIVDTEIMIGTGAGTAGFSLVTGDISLSNAGVVALTSLDLETATVTNIATTEIMIGTGAGAAAFAALTGDVAMTNAGVTTVDNLTLGSDAQGDVYFRGAAGLQRLAASTSGWVLKTQGAGSNPIWEAATVGSAGALLSPFTVEGGTYDPETTVTTQSTGAAALGIPDLNNVAQDWVFTAHAQTFTNKTHTLPIIVTTGAIVDAGGDEYIVFIEDTTPIEHLQLTSGDAGVGVQLKAETSATNADLHLDAAGTGDIIVDNGSELTFARATFDALVVVADQTGEDHTFNIPDIATGASDTFAFLAEAQTFTNKTLTSATLTTPIIVTTGTITDAGGAAYVTFVESATPRDSIQITQGDAGAGATIESITADTNANLVLAAAGAGDIMVSDGTEFIFARSTNNALWVIADQGTAESTLNFPTQANASDTVCLLAEAQTFTNKTITSLIIATGDFIVDAGGDELLGFTESTTPVNFLGVESADTGEEPTLYGAGSDADVGINFLMKGLGATVILSEDAGAVGSTLILKQEGDSQANSDVCSRLIFRGQDNANAVEDYGRIDMVVDDITAANPDGSMLMYVNVAGTLTQRLKIVGGSGNEVVIGSTAAAAALLSNGNNDLVLKTGNATTSQIIITDGPNGAISLLPNGSGPINLGGAIIHSEITTSSGPAAVAITGGVHEVTTTGGGDAMTLANGTAGQRLSVIYVAEGAGGDTAVITPTTLAGGATITLNALGDSCDLVYSSTGGWYVLGLGGTAAVA